MKTIRASHYPETEKPLCGITIADLCQIAVIRFLTLVLTCLDSQKAGIHCSGMNHVVILITWAQIRAAELWQRPFYGMNRGNLTYRSILPRAIQDRRSRATRKLITVMNAIVAQCSQ